jgi:hypothetical protein
MRSRRNASARLNAARAQKQASEDTLSDHDAPLLGWDCRLPQFLAATAPLRLVLVDVAVGKTKSRGTAPHFGPKCECELGCRSRSQSKAVPRLPQAALGRGLPDSHRSRRQRPQRQGTPRIGLEAERGFSVLVQSLWCRPWGVRVPGRFLPKWSSAASQEERVCTAFGA